MEVEGLKQAILEAGIVGAGGAGFPTHIKLVPHMTHLVVNAAECEPLLYTDEQLLAKYGESIVDTVDQVRSICAIQQGVIGIKKKYKQLIEKLEDYASAYEHLTIVPLDNTYPVGDELTLIRACTGKVIQRGKLPSSQGVIVLNVETIKNIHDKLKDDKPVTHTYVTLNGEVTNPKVYQVPIGMTVRNFVKSVGERIEDKLVLMGGPMMGSFVDEDTLITKTTKGIILLPHNHLLYHLKQRATTQSVKRAMSSCSQCRMCTDLCPRNKLGHKVEPHKLMNAFANGILSHYDSIDTALGCCGCNLCSYYACHHDLSPGTLMMEVKREMLKSGYKGAEEAQCVPQDEGYLKVPTTRLVERIGLNAYKEHALFAEEVVQADRVTIPLLQHVGKPAVCIVKEGEEVRCGQLIAMKQEQGISANVHSSLTGVVRQVKSECIVIQEKR